MMFSSSAPGNCSTSSIMTTVGSVTQRTTLSSESDSPLDGVDIPEETSPLLQPKLSEQWKSTRSSFLDDNFGLFLIAAAEFFISAMNAAVKLLNSSDEPVPILEVCDRPLNGYSFLNQL
jgi:hypothetical protein